ncbi:MAG: aminotransferase class IV [Myxococcota bacterium]|jgi:branched-chain amino acid aminotransferase|nr:aminotransferase class IV [Myxococcota bacterium]
MTTGPHAHATDDRNGSVLVYVNGDLVERDQARVSVFDSGFLMGDGVWEGLRLVGGRVPYLEEHLDRLFEGARAIDLDIGMSREALTDAVYRTTRANHMDSGVHIRLMVTRGLKTTPFQGPSVNVGRPTVVVAAEWKDPDPGVVARGLRLFTVHVRRGRPDVQDPAWNSHSKLNCVTACIQAEKAGVDEGLMLDPHGFVATCNSTHFFVVRDGELWTSTGRYCLRGITRANVLRVARQAGIVTRETDFSLTQVYGAQESFVTGTFAGIVHVREVDGRAIGDGEPGPVTRKLMELYASDMAEQCGGAR